MNVNTISPNPAGAAPETQAAAKNTPQKVHEAAQQFESLLISQLLSTMRSSGASWMGEDNADNSSSTAVEMAEQQFAQALSAQGGLGLANLVENGLRQTASKPAPGQKL